MSQISYTFLRNNYTKQGRISTWTREQPGTTRKEKMMGDYTEHLISMAGGDGDSGSGIAEVLAAHRVRSVRIGSHIGIDHMPDIGVYEQRCQNCGQINEPESAHQAAMLTDAGFGKLS